MTTTGNGRSKVGFKPVEVINEDIESLMSEDDDLNRTDEVINLSDVSAMSSARSSCKKGI